MTRPFKSRKRRPRALLLVSMALLHPSLSFSASLHHSRRHCRPNISPITLHINRYNEPSQPLSSWRQFHQSISNSFLSTFICTQLPFAANAATKLETFTDADYGFHLSTPIEWKKTIQTLPGRHKALFFTPDNNDGIIDTLLIIAYAPVRDDFTSLSSFVSVDAVAQATILPKGELGGTADNSRMISAGETYLVQKNMQCNSMH
jgi:hypothetical protein